MTAGDVAGGSGWRTATRNHPLPIAGKRSPDSAAAVEGRPWKRGMSSSRYSAAWKSPWSVASAARRCCHCCRCWANDCWSKVVEVEELDSSGEAEAVEEH